VILGLEEHFSQQREEQDMKPDTRYSVNARDGAIGPAHEMKDNMEAIREGMRITTHDLRGPTAQEKRAMDASIATRCHDIRPPRAAEEQVICTTAGTPTETEMMRDTITRLVREVYEHRDRAWKLEKQLGETQRELDRLRRVRRLEATPVAPARPLGRWGLLNV